jgi:geranylgeranyl diphosphate synthase type 3
VLPKKPTTSTPKNHAINYLKNHTRSFACTLSVLANLEAKIYVETARLGENEGLEAIMDLLHVDETSVT